MLGTENCFLDLFLNSWSFCGVFWFFFLGFVFVLDSSSQLSYASLLFKPEQGQSKQRGEGLPFPPASCLLHVFRLTWSL